MSEGKSAVSKGGVGERGLPLPSGDLFAESSSPDGSSGQFTVHKPFPTAAEAQTVTVPAQCSTLAVPPGEPLPELRH